MGNFMNMINTTKGMLFCAALPFIAVGIFQLIDDNIIRPKYERKLSDDEIYNFMYTHYGIGDDMLKRSTADIGNISICYMKNDFTAIKERVTPELYRFYSLQAEGYIETRMTRVIDIKEITPSYLNLITADRQPKKTKKNQENLSENYSEIFPQKLLLKVSVSGSDYIIENEAGEREQESFKNLKNENASTKNYILEYHSVGEDRASEKSWFLHDIREYNDYYRMKETFYPLLLKKLLKR